MNLVEYAEAELRRAGLFDKETMYGGMLGEAVMRLIRVHAAEEHSGMSNSCVVQLFGKLARFQPLTGLTSDPSEWMEVGCMTWQSRRNPACFSTDGGKTWYDIDERPRVIHTSEAAGGKS